MIGLDTLVWAVFFMIIAAAVVALLWYAITYCESQFPSPFWKFVRIAFILLVIFVIICFLLSLAGYPVIVLPARRAA